MTYLIATEIRGFKYWIKVTERIENTYSVYCAHELQCLKNNATQFTSKKDALDTLSYLKSELPLNIVPYK